MSVREIDGAVREAVVTAVASGIERHGPDAVGIVLKGVPLCALAAAVHYGLDVSVSEVSTGSLAVAAIYAGGRWLASPRTRRGAQPR